MAGIGIQGAGTSGAGYGSPQSAAALTGQILRAPLSGASLDARYINPKTGDYEIDPDTQRLRGMPATHQIVQLSVQTELRSSAISAMGNELRKIDRISKNFKARVLNTLVTSLKPAIDAGLIEVRGFSTFKAGAKDGLQPGQTYGRFQWHDLTTDTAHTEII